jgi:haloalkane dehalogenase
VVRKLTEAEMDHYRQPFLSEASREPVWRWPNELPVGGSPVDLSVTISDIHDWLLQTQLHKTLFWSTPGGLIPPGKAEWYARKMKNARVVDIAAGIHYLQEDNPHLISTEIKDWLASEMGS